MGKKVVDGYPYLYDKVVSELYKEIAGMSIRRSDYSYEYISSLMKDELKTLNGQIWYCDSFISCFGNSSYGSQARDKRYALSNRLSYVSSSLSNWEKRVNYASSKLYDLKRDILAKGPTPPYKTSNWEKYEEFELFGPNTKCYRMKCEIDARTRYSNSYTFYVSSCENDSGYDIEEETGIIFTDYSTMVRDSETIDEGIRKALWEDKLYYDNMKPDEMILFVDFLERNKNGAWWSFGVR